MVKSNIDTIPSVTLLRAVRPSDRKRKAGGTVTLSAAPVVKHAKLISSPLSKTTLVKQEIVDNDADNDGDNDDDYTGEMDTDLDDHSYLGSAVSKSASQTTESEKADSSSAVTVRVNLDGTEAESQTGHLTKDSNSQTEQETEADTQSDHDQSLYMDHFEDMFTKKRDPVTGIHTFTCKECGITSKRKNNITRHLRSHLPDQIRCSACNIFFSTEDEKFKHMDLKHSELVVCHALRPIKSRPMRNEKGHYWRHGFSHQPDMECKYCNELVPGGFHEVYKCSARNKNHPLSCPDSDDAEDTGDENDEGDKEGDTDKKTRRFKLKNFKGPLACDICGQSLRITGSKSHVVRHIARKHGQEAAAEFEGQREERRQKKGSLQSCTECGYFFKGDELALQKHMENYHGEQNSTTVVKCDKCGENITLAEFPKHLETHANQSSRVIYECDSCGNRFETKEEVEHHAATCLLDTPEDEKETVCLLVSAEEDQREEMDPGTMGEIAQSVGTFFINYNT
ncbi:hypothetical protein MAR_015204 [Mya arenaria]|uniref:C2H2-type domain-containing protein n=1 Tax=Mya arenaria TaxID=6604 RepID=A0ABY7FGC2_MYAAR|nr:hypothetical protein MAR_015204 [Mya arenaria]